VRNESDALASNASQPAVMAVVCRLPSRAATRTNSRSDVALINQS
jgi:hypothetical protein